MKASWTFLAGLGAGLLLMFGLALTAFYLNLGVPSGASRWAYEMNERKWRMAEKAAPPKLLIVGGSASLFGISARQIQEQTDRSTISLATHAALGTPYILHLAERAAKPGDTVLLVLEYELYNYGKLNEPWVHGLLVDYVVSRDPAFFHNLSLPEQWNIFMLTSIGRLVDGLKNRFRAERPFNDADVGVYSLQNLNEWGDLTHHSRAKRLAQREGIRQPKTTLVRGLAEHPPGFGPIEQFCRWAQTNHVRVLATFPNLCDNPAYHQPPAQRSAKIIEEFFASLGVPVMGDYTEALLPEDEMLDTEYHPTEEAAAARTARLINKLKPALAAP